ncbi:MAG: TnpV protein [Lachnospiraceae bacterium]|nr:TnpV protein [Lachnospiraceae bacterium]
MEKYIYDEKNGLWYELQGDYYSPCLKLPDEEQRPIGIWGQRHLRYLWRHRKAVYTELYNQKSWSHWKYNRQKACQKRLHVVVYMQDYHV